MFTYHIRPRIYKLEAGQQLEFPNEGEVILAFRPLQPFGMSAEGGRTLVVKAGATLHFNANTGRHYTISTSPLVPLDVVIEEGGGRWQMRGNELHLESRWESLEHLDETVRSLFHVFPLLLNVEWIDPPVVERVYGRVGAVPFSWELLAWDLTADVTTQERQEGRVVASRRRIALVTPPENRRLLAALHYFHAACRLGAAGNSPWEFMSEVLINLRKILEVLFPPRSAGLQTIDAARLGLTELGYAAEEIEGSFIPAMALRNTIDAAHVDLSVFTLEQLTVLHTYCMIAEKAFRVMLVRVMDGMEAGTYALVPSGEPSRRPDANRVIDRMRKYHSDHPARSIGGSP